MAIFYKVSENESVERCTRLSKAIC